MKDLRYNIETQDWDMLVREDGGVDFQITEEPSEQNGGIILLFRAFNSSNPLLGINVNQVRGGSVLQANYEMNRWKAQIFADGGRASFKTILVNGDTNFIWEVNYE